MCGRFALHAPPSAIAELVSLAEIEDFPPRYNIAPTQPILIVAGGREDRPEANTAQRAACLVRWGLIPSWVRDARKFPLLINARAETAREKNAFRGAMKYRRCLIPATEFYEWRRAGGPGKTRAEPFMIRPPGRRPFAFAGLFETAHGPDGGEIDTAAILTTAASGAVAAIHDRMPIVLEEPDYARWLDCRSGSGEDVADLLAGSAASRFETIAITDAVNKVANLGPDIQTPVASAIGAGGTSGHDDAPNDRGTGETGTQLKLF